MGRLTRTTLGVNASDEYDYTSFGANATLARDMNDRNTTLTAGVSFADDTLDPVGGAPIPFAAMVPPDQPQPKAGDDSKTVSDLLLGVTQVISRKTLTQLNYTFSQSDGYLNDPYKIVGEVDATTGLPTGTYLFEQRPDSRNRQSLYWKTVHHLTEDVINFSYRYYWDDWDITSHTLDLKYRYELGGSGYLQPHIRYYSQSEADFYRHSLLQGEALPENASADYRLGEFESLTLGLKYGVSVFQDSEFSVRAEFLQQSGDSSPADAVGDQRNQDLFPTVEATILQVGYSVRW